MNDKQPSPTADELQRIKAAREAALLRRWLSGRRLTPGEMSELQHLLPVGLLANPPPAPTNYARLYKDYAAELGCDVRNIKRYIEIGRGAKPDPDLPPFDNPPAFLAWWRRHMRHTPPDRVLAFSRAGDPAAAAPGVDAAPDASAAPPPDAVAAPGAAPLPGAKSAPAGPALGFEFVGAGGFEESVRELRMTVTAAQTRMRRAMTAEPLDESLVASCGRAVEKQLDLLRKAENDLFEMQQRRGELVPRAEVREDWRTLLASLRQMRRRMSVNVAATLNKGELAFSPEQLAAITAAVEEERSREDQLLRTSTVWRKSPDVSR